VTALSGLEVENLSLQRGGRMLFRNIAFNVAAGGVLALEGPNGAGKTSLLRAIAGFLEPRGGSISLRTSDGKGFTSGDERAQFVGWLGHLDGLKPQLSAIEALSFFARFYQASQTIEAALSTVGLERLRDLPIQYFSAGQKRRLALARLSLSARPLWLLDEPLAALDAAGKALAAQLIAAHCGKGGVAIIATHEALGIDCARLKLGDGSQ
jgi:heme exporter protein A